MGASKSKRQAVSDPPASEHPYCGPSAEYHFIKTNVVIGVKMPFVFLGTPMITSNIDTYYPILAAKYAEGYRLLSFYRIPGQMQKRGISKMALGFQGIFCRYPSAPRRGNWKLRVEKSMIQLEVTHIGIIAFARGRMVSDTTHLLDSITRNTQDGGRLVRVEMTGGQQKGTARQALKGLSPLLGVDLFFEIPDSDTVGIQQYVYKCEPVPIKVTAQGGFRPIPRSHCDWMGTLAAHLNLGWRLVEVFMDKGLDRYTRGFSSHLDLNSLWFFEKPASRLDDPTPVYEGTVIDHSIKLKTSGFNSVNTTTRWETVIQQMGEKGWELACILELFDWEFTGMATVYMKCKLFFQRPILSGAIAQDLPPPYDIAVERLPVGSNIGAEYCLEYPFGGFHDHSTGSRKICDRGAEYDPGYPDGGFQDRSAAGRRIGDRRAEYDLEYPFGGFHDRSVGGRKFDDRGAEYDPEYPVAGFHDRSAGGRKFGDRGAEYDPGYPVGGFHDRSAGNKKVCDRGAEYDPEYPFGGFQDHSAGGRKIGDRGAEYDPEYPFGGFHSAGEKMGY